VVWLSLGVLLAMPVCAQSVEEAAERLARKIAVTLRTPPPIGISIENRSRLSIPVERVRAILAREINKDTAAPSGPPGVSAHVADSASGPLLIATVDCGESPCVSMERFRPDDDTPRSSLTRRPVISQAGPILDFVLGEDSLAVLESNRVAVHKQSGDKWMLTHSLPFTPALPMPRDPRGRLFVRDGAYEIRIPGSTCTGTTTLVCKADESTWRESDIELAWKPRRNILVLPDGMAGEDFAQINSDCGVSRLSVTGSTVETRGAQPLTLRGTAVALWSSETPAEATLVVFNPSTHAYEASRVAMRCDR
jgi:hypothetical protein